MLWYVSDNAHYTLNKTL